MNEIILSVCIPTYNRAEMVAELIVNLLTIEKSSEYEVCVHDDGSVDNTLELLKRVKDDRLKIFTAPNQGRAGAIASLVHDAKGRFIMIYDDDDWFLPDGVSKILSDCRKPMPEGVVGHVYNMENSSGVCIGTKLRDKRTNFLAMRADEGVKGDKKEVVLSVILKSVMYDKGFGYRRVPTSLLWSRIALQYDVQSHESIIGGKIYLDGGMSNGIRKLKSENAWPMCLLYLVHVRGFFKCRYRSSRYLFKALVGVAYYSFLAVFRTNKRIFS